MIKEFRNKKGQVCGTWKDGIYRKQVNSTKHRLRVMNAYGIDKVIVQKLQELGTSQIRILETDTKQIYFITFESFLALGVERNLDGAQIFLPVHYFKTEAYVKEKS